MYSAVERLLVVGADVQNVNSRKTDDERIETNVWEDLSRDYTQTMGAPSFGRIWLLRKQNYDPSFQEYVDKLTSREYVVR